MILSVILCCVCFISVQIEARTTNTPYVEQQAEDKMKSYQEENDVYGRERTQLNGRVPRAPAWPEVGTNMSDTKKIFLLPSILKEGDQINVTALILKYPQRFTFSLITEQNGQDGKEPDYNNIACQLEINFPSNGSLDNTIVLKTIANGMEEALPVAEYDLNSTDLIPDFASGISVPVTIRAAATSNEVNFDIGESFFKKISLKHNFSDIRFIAFGGDVEKVQRLDFIYE